MLGFCLGETHRAEVLGVLNLEASAGKHAPIDQARAGRGPDIPK